MITLDQQARLDALECGDDITEDDLILFGSSIHVCPDLDYMYIFDKMKEYKNCDCILLH